VEFDVIAVAKPEPINIGPADAHVQLTRVS
jgi:hypothetical protein